MQVQNNKEEVPFAHYQVKFRALSPEEASAATVQFSTTMPQP